MSYGKSDPYESLPVITATEVGGIFDDCFKDGRDGKQIAVPMLYGAPGIGKSSIIAQYADSRGYAVLDVRLAQVQPEFIAGVQYPDDSKSCAHTLKPDAIGRVERLYADTGKPVILLCDELTLASAETLSAALELILDKRVAGFKLPHATRVVAAGNRTTDTSSAVILDPPVRSRLWSTILETTPTEVADYLRDALPESPLVNATLAWLTGSNARAWFARNRMVGDEAVFFTPRGLEQGLRLAAAYVKGPEDMKPTGPAALRMVGSVGRQVWDGICAYAAVAATVRKPEEVLRNPTEHDAPGTTEGFIAQMGAIYRHVSALKSKADRGKAEKAVAIYLEHCAAANAEMVRVWATQSTEAARDLLCSTIAARRVLSDVGAIGANDLAALARAARNV